MKIEKHLSGLGPKDVPLAKFHGLVEKVHAPGFQFAGIDQPGAPLFSSVYANADPLGGFGSQYARREILELSIALDVRRSDRLRSGNNFPGSEGIFRKLSSALRVETVLPQHVVNAARGDSQHSSRLRLIAAGTPQRDLHKKFLANGQTLRETASVCLKQAGEHEIYRWRRLGQIIGAPLRPLSLGELGPHFL